MFNRTSLFIVSSVISLALFGWSLHTWKIDRLEIKHRNAMESQKNTLLAQCAADKQITTEVSSVFQNDLIDLDNQLSDIKRVRPSTCLSVDLASTASGRHDGAATGELPASNGRTARLSSHDLYDFAGDAEKTRLQLRACQSFIRKTWASKGQ